MYSDLIEEDAIAFVKASYCKCCIFRTKRDKTVLKSKNGFKVIVTYMFKTLKRIMKKYWLNFQELLYLEEHERNKIFT